MSLGGNGRMGLVWFSLRLLLTRETFAFLSEFSISSSNSPWFWDQTALQSVTSGVRAAHILWSKSWEIEIDSLNLSYIIATEGLL